MGSLRRKTLWGAAWSALQRLGAQGLSLIVFIGMTRLLAPSDLGLASMAYVVISVGNVILDQGLSPALVQLPELEDDHLHAAFWWNAGLGLTMSALLVVMAGAFAWLFREPRLAPVLVGMSPVFLLGGLRGTQAAILQRDFRFRDLATRTIAGEAVGGALGLAMAFAGFGVWSLVGQSLGRSVTSTAVLWSVSSWRPRWRLSRPHLQGLLRFGSSAAGDRLLQLGREKIDDFFVGSVLGATALGYYTIGYRLLNFVSELIGGTVKSVSLPAFARLSAAGREVRRAFLTMNEFHALVSFPVFVGVFLAAPRIVPLVFGSQWIPGVPVMQVLSLVGAIRVLPAGVSILLLAIGRPGVNLRLSVVEVAATSIGVVLVVSQGILPVALVHLAVGLALLIPDAFLLQRYVGLGTRAWLRSFLCATVGCVAMGAAYLAVDRNLTPGSAPWASLVGLVLLAAGTYLAVTRLLFSGVYHTARSWAAEMLKRPGPDAPIEWQG
jgi:PST family polysaccharide transporter